MAIFYTKCSLDSRVIRRKFDHAHGSKRFTLSAMSAPIVSAPSEEVAALHAQVRHYESELTERDTVIAEHQAVIAQRDAMIEHLQEQVWLLVARRFAPSSEKIPDGQLGLFNEAEATAAEEPESAPGTEIAAHRRGTPPPWRQTPSKSPFLAARQ